MWLFNSCHLPVSPAGFPASLLSPSDYSEGVQSNRELNLSSAWMHRSHLKFCGTEKFTWRLCPIILSLAIWTVWASRMVSPVVSGRTSPSVRLQSFSTGPTGSGPLRTPAMVTVLWASVTQRNMTLRSTLPPEINRIKHTHDMRHTLTCNYKNNYSFYNRRYSMLFIWLMKRWKCLATLFIHPFCFLVPSAQYGLVSQSQGC